MRGTVTKKGNRWYIVYTIGVRPDGKRHQKWESGFRTKKEAELALAKRLVEVGMNNYVEPSRQTFAEFVETWASDKRSQVRGTTWRSYDWIIRQYIVPYLGRYKLQEIKAPQIQQFYSALRQSPRKDGKPGNLSERSILHVHLLLHQIFKRAVKWGHIMSNPCDLVDKPRPMEPELQVWTLDEVRAFLSYAQEDEQYYIVFLLLSTTGMRIGEVLGLRWQDVHFADNSISIVQQVVFVDGGYEFTPPKTKAGRRTLDVNQEVIDALEKHKKYLADIKEKMGDKYRYDLDLVSCTEKGTPLYHGNVTDRYNKIIERAGLQRIRIHDNRHTHATLLLEQGESLKVVQERLGHEKADVLLNRYAHVLPRTQRKAVDTFGKRLFGSNENAPELEEKT